MSLIARGLFLAVFAIFAGAPAAYAETRGAELAPLTAWVAKSTQKATIDGKVARALGLSQDGKPIQLTAVTTAYLDGSRIIHLLRGPQGETLVLSQGKGNNQGTWMMTNGAGTLVRAVQWVPTSANPAPMDAAAAAPLFTETKAFWKAQLGTPVR